MCRTGTNFRKMYVSRMSQIQNFHNYIFEDRWLDIVNDHVSRNEFQGLGMHTIRKTVKFMAIETLYGIVF